MVFASFAVQRMWMPHLTVDTLNFFFATNNLFQPFSAFDQRFLDGRHRDGAFFGDGRLHETPGGCFASVGTLEVDFPGTDET